jgi:hypothetical protein
MRYNWVKSLASLTRQGGWHWTPAGKLRMNIAAQPWETPWLLADPRIPGILETGLDCGIFHTFHEHVLQKLAVHSFCMECYKVVIMPTTKEQVHKIAGWQKETGWSCKVGAEIRNYTQRKWGAYFYCRGIEEGRERYKEVRKWVDENLGEDIEVILKRGCTEFEQSLGDSSQWEMIPEQEVLEQEFREIIDYVPMTEAQAPAIAHAVWDFWDKWEKDNQKPTTYHEEEK